MEDQKKCKFYLFRHGETEWNAQGRVQGHTDIPLSQIGEQQARQKADEFKSFDFHEIISSDLLRAKHTAEFFASGRSLSVKTVPYLREQSWGPWEGGKFEAMYNLFGPGFNQYTGTSLHSIPGVESHLNVAIRVKSYLIQAAELYLGKSVLVVTHGAVLKSLIYTMDIKEHFKSRFNNLGYIIMESNGTELQFLEAHGLIASVTKTAV